jgi:hypothetical protein
LLAIGFASFSVVTAHAQTRVALVTTCGGDTGADVLALAEAKLSQQAGIELVERREVERVLQEQNLAVCGLSGYAQALTVGKMLGVKVFAALEIFPGEKDALGLVVFDAVSGVRLADMAMPAGNSAKVADSVFATVIQACAKRQAGPNAPQTICLLTIRNADLPRALDSLCQSVGRLIETRLVNSPGITVLERQRLEQVNQERRLPTDAVPTELMPSLTLLELEIARGTNGQGLRATAFLTGPAGAEVVKVRASTPTMSALDLAETLVGELTRVLHALPVPPNGDRAREAERFRQEANLLIDHDQYGPGLQAAEAALALEPDDAKFMGTFVGYLLRAAKDVLKPGLNDKTENLKRSLAMAQRALDLIEQTSRETHGNVTLDESLSGKGVPVGDATEHSILFRYLTGPILRQQGYDDETRAQLAAFQQQFWEMLWEVHERTYQAVSDAASFQDYTSWLCNYPMKNIEYLAPSADAYTSHCIALLSRWAELARKYPLTWQLNFAVNRLLGRPTARNRQGWPADPVLKKRCELSDANLGRWQVFYQSLGQDSNPLFNVYGAIGRLWAEQNATSMPTNMVIDRVQAILRLAEGKIATLNDESTDGVRLLCYQAMLDALALLPQSELGGQIRCEARAQILEFMLGRREVIGFIIRDVDRDYDAYINAGDVIHVSSSSAFQYPTETEAQMLERADRITGAITTNECRYWGINRQQLEREMQEIRDRIAAAQAPTPWSAARLLFDPAEYGFQSIKAVLVEHDDAWVVGQGGNRRAAYLQLAKVPLAGGPVQLLGSAKHEIDDHGAPLYDAIPDIGLCNGRICFGSRHDGIFIFPVDGGPAEHITVADGLPSNDMGAITAVDGKLYAGQNYLVSYDFASKEVRVLSSSLRKEQQSPLDDGRTFFVQHLRSDPARHRVLFTITRSPGPDGLWQIDLKTGEIRRLIEYDEIGGWVSPILDDHLLMYLWNHRAVLSVDLNTDTAEVRYEPFFPNPIAKGVIPTARTVMLRSEPQPPYLIRDGWLWTADPLGRFSPDGKQHEFFPPIKGLSSSSYYSWRCMLAVGHGKQILAGTADSLWLLDFKDK